MKKNRRYFQWIAGEMKGEVVTLDNIEEFEGETFYNFDDGEACNQRFIAKMTNNASDLKEKFMVEIESPSNPWSFETVQSKKYIDESMKGEDIDIPTLHDMLQCHGDNSTLTNSDLGSEKLIPPKRSQHIIDLPTFEEYAKTVETPSKTPQAEMKTDKPTVEPPSVKTHKDEQKEETVKKSFDPIRILVDSCKKHDTQIDLTLNMKLPSKVISNIADSEFEDGFDKFIDCVVSDIDTELIIKELRKALSESYKS